MSRLRSMLRILGIVALGLIVISPALATQSQPSSTLAREKAIALLREGNGSLVIYRDQQTGVPNFVAGALPAVAAGATNPQEAARAFFKQNTGMFRMRNPDSELSLIRDERDRIGMKHVRFQQRHNGVEVFGAVLIAHTRGVQVDSVTGTYVPDLSVDTQPSQTFEQAVALARAKVGQADAVVAQERSGLAIYARDGHSALTWKVELQSQAGDGRWLLFVDAHHGTLIHAINMTQTARQRETYNALPGSSTLPGTLLCTEANASGCQGDLAAKAAHDYAGLVYDYYQSAFGRDSIDGQGMTIISTVHYGVEYNNAFWSGAQMVYGDGDGSFFGPLSQSLDVVAHELTHGVTDFSADLVYEDQSGALNESYSDVLGVFADAFGKNTTTVNWALGEDVYTPGTAGDALRDMADPHKGSDPFTLAYTCSYRPGQPYYCGQPSTFAEYARLPLSLTEEVPSDNGGVHVNSGIPNKAAQLLTDGGTFGGVTVAGIGVKKAEQIYYRTLAFYLTPRSNFLVARNASIQACADLIGQFSITADDCGSVRDAFAAVGIGNRANLTRTVFLPTLSHGIGAPAGIYGRITVNRNATAGITVQLQRCDGRVGTCQNVTSATTDATGSYQFLAGPGIPSTDAYTWYRVLYISPSNQPDGRVLLWFSDDIAPYQQGSSLRMNTFDIGDVTLLTPNDSISRGFPVSFTWQARPVGGDYYYWELYDSDFDIIALEYSFLMHTSPSFTLNSASDPQLLPGSSLSGATYWDVVVVSPAGWGITWNSNRVAFPGAAASQTNVAAIRRARIVRLADQLHPQFQIGVGK
jgi:bacillolysin